MTSLFNIKKQSECDHRWDLDDAEGNMHTGDKYLKLWWECQNCPKGRVITYSNMDGVWMPVMIKERATEQNEYEVI